MLDQYFGTDQDQDNASGDLSILSELSADAVAEKDGNKAEYTGGDADQTDGRDNAHLKESEADADSERVNACGNSQKQDLPGRDRVNALGTDPVLLTGFADHVDPDNAKQDKGDPVID